MKLKKKLNYCDKTSPLWITKMLFRSFACKIPTKRPFENADTVLDCEYGVTHENTIILTIKCNMSDMELRKGNTKVGKLGVNSFPFFII